MKIPTLLSLLLLASTLTAAPWTTGGPHGSSFASLAAVASNPNVVYAAAGHQGVFRTDDNGATWRNVTNGLSATQFVAADPHDPDSAYAIAGGEFRNAWRTTDGGATWTVMDLGRLRRLNTILVDPNDAKTLYASSDCGFYLEPLFHDAGLMKSTDGGVTWRDASSGLSGFAICVTSLALDPANPSHLFVNASYSGGWESFDGAATWVKAGNSLPTREVVIDPYQPSVRYGTNGNQVLRSDDGGVHWFPQPGAGIPDAPISEQRLADLSLDPVTPRIFSATIAGLYRSGDGGRSWIPAGDVPRIRVNAVVFNPTESTVMIATSQGVFRAPSPAFTPWTQLAVPESAIDIEQIAVDPRSSPIVYASTFDAFYGTPQGRVFRSRDGGANWEQLGERFGVRARLGVDASGDLWFADLQGKTLHRVPAGTNDVTAIAQTFDAITTIAAHPAVPGLVYIGSGNGEILRSNDAGSTWTRCQSLFSPLPQLALDASSDTVFAATLLGMYRSSDGCATFQRLDQNETVAVSVAPSNPSIVYRSAKDYSVSSARLIWRSEDRGTTWTPASPPFATLGVETIVVDPRDARRLWIADRDRGVWESSDGGATWMDVSDGLPERSTQALAIDSSGSVLHAGLWQNGVWELRVRGRQRAVRPR